MKITSTVKLDTSHIHVSKHTRSDLAKEVEKYWLGKKTSNIGLQYLTLKNGIIEASEGTWERKDLLMFQLIIPGEKFAGFNLFYGPDDHMNWNVFEGTELTKEEMAKVEAWVRTKVQEPDLAKFLAHERQFLAAKPWLQVDGLTPEAALNKFKELGQYST